MGCQLSRRRPAGRPLTREGFCGRRVSNLLRSAGCLDCRIPEFRRVRIEAENELTGPFFDKRCESVAKGLRLSLDQPPLTVCLSFAPAENFGTLLAAIWIVAPVWGLTP